MKYALQLTERELKTLQTMMQESDIDKIKKFTLEELYLHIHNNNKYQMPKNTIGFNAARKIAIILGIK